MLKRKLSSYITELFLLIFLISLLFFSGSLQPRQISANGIRDKSFFELSSKSRAGMVTDMVTIKSRIERLEQTGGKSEGTGAKVFSAAETAHLIKLYQDLRSYLIYLNSGNPSEFQEWEGYQLLSNGEVPYESKQVLQILDELKNEKLPPAFLADFRVYLLPYEIPEISGLGGSGFALISAPAANNRSIEQLRVTLLHEIGHHIHSRFIGADNRGANELWNNYLRIRGGEWQGPGRVNTAAWSNSTEETFAEDFRMLFGKGQPFYRDISLGDPRDNPDTAAKVREFVLSLKDEKIVEKVESPWIPAGMSFWLYSRYFILAGWLIIAAGACIVLKREKTAAVRDFSSKSYVGMLKEPAAF